jgi:DNA-binding beta-propeller fold protein YncE
VTVLRVTAGPAAGSTIAVDGEVTIGRDGRPGGVSFEADDEISRRHAQFRPLASGAVLLEDLGSSNGTFVNGDRIDIPRLLALGDEIRVGHSVMYLERATDPKQEATTLLATGARSTSAVPDVRTLPAPSPALVVDPPAPRRSGTHRVAVAVAGAVVGVVVGLAIGLVAGHPGTVKAAVDTPQESGTGTVYLESGVAQPSANSIIAFRYGAGGDLHPLDIRSYPTGGAGAFDLTNTGALDADGQIATSADHKLLFAVNQGSDTVAVFHVLPDGSLAAVAGSPFSSNGVAPGGLAINGDRLVVVNKAQDGVRELQSVSPNVTSFLVEPDGVLRPTGSVVTLPPASSPTEALISPDGRVVVVPEEHGPFVSLTLGSEGQLSPAPGSPFGLPDAIFPADLPTTERWALGLATQPGGGVLYGQAVDTAQMVTFRYDDSGRLTFVGAVAEPGAYLPCWSLLNAAGTRLYTDNAGNNTMSVFGLTNPLAPRLLQVVTLKDAGNPWDLRMDPSGRFVFVLDARDREDLVPAGQGNELHTLLVNGDGTLTEAAYSPVPIPVPLNTNPIGLAVIGH